MIQWCARAVGEAGAAAAGVRRLRRPSLARVRGLAWVVTTSTAQPQQCVSWWWARENRWSETNNKLNQWCCRVTTVVTAFYQHSHSQANHHHSHVT